MAACVLSCLLFVIVVRLQVLDGRTIHVREDQQEGMPPPSVAMAMGMGGGGPMGHGMGGGGGGMHGGGGGMGMGRPPMQQQQRRSNVDPEMRRTCQV